MHREEDLSRPSRERLGAQLEKSEALLGQEHSYNDSLVYSPNERRNREQELRVGLTIAGEVSDLGKIWDKIFHKPEAKSDRFQEKVSGRQAKRYWVGPTRNSGKPSYRAK